MNLRTIAGTAHRVGECDVCGGRVECDRRPGTTACPGCGMPYDHLTGRAQTARLLEELGHLAPVIVPLASLRRLRRQRRA